MRKIPWRRKWQPSPVFLPGKFHGQRSLVDYSPWGCKESDMSECTHTHTHTLLCQAKWSTVGSCPWKTVSPHLRGFGKFYSSVSREVVVNTIKVCAGPGMPTRLLSPWNFPGKNPELVAISSFREPSQLMGQICVSCVSKQILYPWSPYAGLAFL